MTSVRHSDTANSAAARDRLAASVTAAVIAAQRGASLLRVHDVAATVDALAIMNGVNAATRTNLDTVR
jgi:dihydropteroate synthase